MILCVSLLSKKLNKENLNLKSKIYSLEELAAATLTKRIVWEESVDSAKAAAKHARVRRTLDKLNCGNYDELQTSFFSSPREEEAAEGEEGGRIGTILKQHF